MEEKMFGLDKYTRDLLIEYFKSKPSIKFARIYGSRVKGTNRPSSDIDMFIEGTYPEFMPEIFDEEINALKHPYRIDLVSIKKENIEKADFVSRNYKESEYFYKAKDYYPQDNYEEVGFETLIDDAGVKRWKCRYKDNFKRRLDEFYPMLEECEKQMENGIDDIPFQIALFENFKAVFEGLWKTIKHYYKTKGIIIMYPRKLFEKAYEDKMTPDFSVWESLIYDFNIMTDEAFSGINDEMFYRLKTKYLPAMEEFKNFFEQQKEED